MKLLKISIKKGNNKVNFAENLKALRRERNITQKYLADYLGLSINSYSQYELGHTEPNYKNLKKLADFFCVSIDYLLDSNSQPTNNYNKIELGNVSVEHTFSPSTEDEEKLLSAFRLLDKIDQETVLIQLTAIAREKGFK